MNNDDDRYARDSRHRPLDGPPGLAVILGCLLLTVVLVLYAAYAGGR